MGSRGYLRYLSFNNIVVLCAEKRLEKPSDQNISISTAVVESES